MSNTKFSFGQPISTRHCGSAISSPINEMTSNPHRIDVKISNTQEIKKLLSQNSTTKSATSNNSRSVSGQHWTISSDQPAINGRMVDKIIIADLNFHHTYNLTVYIDTIKWDYHIRSLNRLDPKKTEPWQLETNRQRDGETKRDQIIEMKPE